MTDNAPAEAASVRLPATGDTGTGLVLVTVAGALPRIAWLGPLAAGLSATDLARATGLTGAAPSVHESTGRALPVLTEVSTHWFGQPGLRGYRIAPSTPGAASSTGADWSSAFVQDALSTSDTGIELTASDVARGLSLRTEWQMVAGGAVRARHHLTNQAAGTFVVDGLDVMMPLPDRVSEILDLTGRWGRERSPQRHPVRDGIWLREGRTGKTGPESPTVLSVGTAGFGFGHGEVWGTHLAWSGNARHFVERLPSGQTVLGAGELLLPGEIALATGQTYATP